MLIRLTTCFLLLFFNLAFSVPAKSTIRVNVTNGGGLGFVSIPTLDNKLHTFICHARHSSPLVEGNIRIWANYREGIISPIAREITLKDVAPEYADNTHNHEIGISIAALDPIVTENGSNIVVINCHLESQA